jgi:hypothetical protein
MDLRNISGIAPVAEDNGTSAVWLRFPATTRDITYGGSLEPINEFAVTGGGALSIPTPTRPASSITCSTARA